MYRRSVTDVSILQSVTVCTNFTISNTISILRSLTGFINFTIYNSKYQFYNLLQYVSVLLSVTVCRNFMSCNSICQSIRVLTPFHSMKKKIVENFLSLSLSTISPHILPAATECPRLLSSHNATNK